jgi:endonuclease-3
VRLEKEKKEKEQRKNSLKVERIIKILERRYRTRLFKRSDPFYVLISTVLSQRTKDENTEKAAKALFSRFTTPQQLAAADTKEIENLIRPSGFYRQKAKSIKKISQIIIERYNSTVPRRFEELVALPGVGRKTANCVLVYGYKIPAIPVDVHVHVISNRLGIVKTKRPEDTEKQLAHIVPKKYWIHLNELFVRYGQEICKSRPLCKICIIKRFCDYYKQHVTTLTTFEKLEKLEKLRKK